MSTQEYKTILQQGQQAKEKLLLSNLRLVLSVARRFIGKGLPLEDLVQEGNLGLIRAVEKFDPERGNRFSTYATFWIRQGCTRALADKSRIIRLPAYMHELVLKARRTRSKLSASLGRAATDEEVAAALSVHPNRIQKLHLIPKTIALDGPLKNGRKIEPDRASTLEDIISVDLPDVTVQLDATLLRAELEGALASHLLPVERDILRLRYGLDDGVFKTCPTVGNIAGMKAVKVRSVEEAALRKLRRKSVTARLEDFVASDLDV